MSALDRQSVIPLYHQIINDIKEQVKSKKLVPGDQIPPEHEMCKIYRVSRMTVRKAISDLVSEGILRSQKGVGTFVAAPRIDRRISKILSFTEDMQSRGLKPSSLVLKQETISASKEVAEKLQIKPGESVILIERLRLANGSPMGLEYSHIPYKMCPELLEEELATQSLYQLLENKYHFNLFSAEEEIKARTATRYETEVLHVPAGSALIIFNRILYLDNNVPIEFGRCIYRGDSYSFYITSYRR